MTMAAVIYLLCALTSALWASFDGGLGFDGWLDGGDWW